MKKINVVDRGGNVVAKTDTEWLKIIAEEADYSHDEYDTPLSKSIEMMEKRLEKNLGEIIEAYTNPYVERYDEGHCAQRKKDLTSNGLFLKINEKENKQQLDCAASRLYLSYEHKKELQSISSNKDAKSFFSYLEQNKSRLFDEDINALYSTLVHNAKNPKDQKPLPEPRREKDKAKNEENKSRYAEFVEKAGKFLQLSKHIPEYFANISRGDEFAGMLDSLLGDSIKELRRAAK